MGGLWGAEKTENGGANWNGAIERPLATQAELKLLLFQFQNGAIERGVPGTGATGDVRFNSKMVRLRGGVFSVDRYDIFGFQFQNGAIESRYAIMAMEGKPMFQFQNGAIERFLNNKAVAVLP